MLILNYNVWLFRDSVYLDRGVLGLTPCSLVVVRSTQKLEALCVQGNVWYPLIRLHIVRNHKISD